MVGVGFVGREVDFAEEFLLVVFEFATFWGSVEFSSGGRLVYLHHSCISAK